MVRWRTCRSIRSAITSLVVVSCVMLVAVETQAADALVETPVKDLGRVYSGGHLKIALSPDGTRIASWEYGPGGQVPVICDGKELPPYDSIYQLGFSGDGRRLGCIAKKGVLHFFVCDGKEVGRVRSWNSEFAFSPDGKRVAHVAEVEDETCLLLDGDKQPFSGPGKPVFSPDSRHLAYTTDWDKSVVCSGRKSPTYDAVGVPVFAPNSKRMAYAACRENVWFIVCGRSQFGSFAEVGTPVFHPDCRTLACRSRVGEKWLIVCGTKRDREYDAVTDPVFSPNGKCMAYGAATDGVSFVVCAGRKSPNCNKVAWLGFSRDSKHLACVIERGGSSLMTCDGLDGPVHASVLVPERYEAPGGKLRYVVIDAQQAKLVEVDWPKGRTWEDVFRADGVKPEEKKEPVETRRETGTERVDEEEE